MDRRKFFRRGLRELLKPLAQVVDTATGVARQVSQLDPPAPPTPPAPAPTIKPPDGVTAARGTSRAPARRPDQTSP